MRTNSRKIIFRFSVVCLTTLFLSAGWLSAQNISFGIFADPVISWFSTNTSETQNSGARAGFNFGFTFNKYFTDNYAFSTGISILNAGGRLKNSNSIKMKLDNLPDTIIPAGKSVVYKVQYLSIPIGLKLRSNQIGYITFFTDIGVDPKFVVGGKVDVKVDVPLISIKGESAMNELKKFNMSYHILAGIEYSLGGSTAIVFGLGFDDNFLDLTKDIYSQPVDKVSHKILKFRFGVNF